MCNSSDQVDNAIDAFSDHTAARVGALLDKYGLAIFDEDGRTIYDKLPYSVKCEVRRAYVETAREYFPTPDAERIAHFNLSALHPFYWKAHEWLSWLLAGQGPGSVVGSVAGIESAVVLAGYGLPVAPLDAVGRRIIGKPSNDIDTVLSLLRITKTLWWCTTSASRPFTCFWSTASAP
jgi:hypothetical protein